MFDQTSNNKIYVIVKNSKQQTYIQTKINSLINCFITKRSGFQSFFFFNEKRGRVRKMLFQIAPRNLVLSSGKFTSRTKIAK